MYSICIHGGGINLRDVRYHEIIDEKVVVVVRENANKGNRMEVFWMIDEHLGGSQSGDRLKYPGYSWTRCSAMKRFHKTIYVDELVSGLMHRRTRVMGQPAVWWGHRQMR